MAGEDDVLSLWDPRTGRQLARTVLTGLIDRVRRCPPPPGEPAGSWVLVCGRGMAAVRIGAGAGAGAG